MRIFLLVLGILLFLPFLGLAPLFDWDEINFAESAREMLITGNYARVQINFQPFWEKPPLFFWMQSVCMNLFGINEYAARLPNAIFGIISLLTVFEIGRILKSKLFGFLWAICLAGSFLPHVYFKSGIIDPVFNFFIFLSVWFIYRAVQTNHALKPTILSGLFAGLAILTKGPVGLLIPILTITVFVAIGKFRYFPPFKIIALWGLTALIVSLAWFGPETIQNGPWFLEAFFRYQIRLFSTPDAGHGQPFYYHFVVVLIGCFPMSAFGFAHLIKKGEALTKETNFTIWMKILFWIVMILFSLVTTKIVHYSSLAYLPLAFMAAIELNSIIQRKTTWNKASLVIYSITGLILGLVLLVLPLIGNNPGLIIDLVKDPFAKQNLNAAVDWPWFTFLPGIIWIIGLLLTFWFILIKREVSSVITAFGAVILGLMFFLPLIPARIAQYTQQAPIEFYKSLKNKDVYIETLGFKSYAQYFYTGKKSLSDQEKIFGTDADGSYNSDQLRNWLLTGKIDKPAYFVTKTIQEDDFVRQFNLTCIGRKNGFSFLFRPIPEVQ
jgi:4-amino-4-deoxy-L-arabinose transferase-like glycosyltransferase